MLPWQDEEISSVAESQIMLWDYVNLITKWTGKQGN